MAQKRKLQVFVSSTFIDLKSERQSAVEAILTTGHIPAGMELFAGKNEDQMNIIKRWIDESDVYLLLLGGRYGSVDKTSGKSYTHLEYDYAVSQRKTVFVVVATDDYINKRVKESERGVSEVMELDHRIEYEAFKKDITGRYVKHWGTADQLKLAIINTLHEIDRDENLVGWVPGSEITNSGAIAEQLAKLVKENSDLREQLKVNSKEANPTLYCGLTFAQMTELLNQEVINLDSVREGYRELLYIACDVFGDETPSVLHLFFVVQDSIENEGQDILTVDSEIYFGIQRIARIGLMEIKALSRSTKVFNYTQEGKNFLLRLKVEHDSLKWNEHLARLMRDILSK